MIPILLIVTGPPCAGKTTLGKRIARELGWPLINKDGIKEALFDTLGWQDRAWSKKLGYASYTVLFYVVEAQLAAGCSVVVESNFRVEFDSERFQALARCHPFRAVQILCHAAPETLLQRFAQRTASGERHPGHVDHLYYEEFVASLAQYTYTPLVLDGPVLAVDTTDFEKLDYAEIWAAVKTAFSNEASLRTDKANTHRRVR